MTVLEMENPAVLDGTPRRFTPHEYAKIHELGLLGDGADLVDGIVVIRGTTRPWRWTTDDYHKMAEEGIIDEDERVELIDGEVIALASIGPEHRACVGRLTRLLIRLEKAFGPSHYVMAEAPVHIANDQEPQPDIAIASGSLEEYDHRHPVTSDLRLVVEVSNSSLRTDKARKYLLYAQMGIPEYWVVNLPERTLEVYREPSGTGYGAARTYRSGDSLEPAFAPGVMIKVDDVLPS
jgi:Uma2 family endonuclease